MARASFSPELVLSAQRGEAGARDDLVDQALPVVLEWCARLGGPTVDAEDACHDVCIVLITKIDGLTDPNRFASWLFGSTRRVLAAHRRKAWVRKWVPGVEADPVDEAPDAARTAVRSDLARRVQSALEQLPEVQREVLVLFDVEERSESEVAAILSIPIGTARSRLRAARERFRSVSARMDLLDNVVAFDRQERT
jgi:RNA polymerase sigma-70 factor (ECF subfamily)